ncbi:MAG: site-specific integrase [Clostridium beijerinckii]|nr:site-specific integrase [Clostridium beijerinckii]
MDNKWNWNMDEKTENIYKNLCNQIEKVFSHTRQCSIKTRHRYMDGVKHFAKFLAEEFKKQNLNKIKSKHLLEYVEQMQEWGYSKSYVTTNLSAVRYFIDIMGGESNKLPSNKELSVDIRTKGDRIGANRAWRVEEVQRFIEFAESVGQNKYADMVRVGWAYGLRIHEVTRLNKNDLFNALAEKELTVKGKGGLIRTIPLHDVDLIKKLYNATPVGEKVFVKTNEKTHHVINNLQNYIIRHQEKFVITVETNRSFHGLRHAYAQRRYQELVDIGYIDRNARIKVSRELGHFRIEITEIYLK